MLINPYAFVSAGNLSLIDILTTLGLTSGLQLALDAGDGDSIAVSNAAYARLHVHFDGSDAATTFPDSSSFQRSPTVNGNAQIDTAQSKFGGASGLFDGTGDDLSYTYAATLHPGSSDFTWQAWVRPANTSAGFRSIWAQGNAYGPFLVAQNGTAYLLYATNTNGVWDVANGVSLGTAAANTWTHLAVVRSGSTIKLFQDGTQVGSDIAVSGSLYNPSTAFTVGSQGGANYYNGHVDELLYEIGNARFTGTFTPETSAYPNSKWNDTSGNGYDFRFGDGATTTTFPTINGTPGALASGNYLSFDGGDYLTYDSTNEAWMDALHKASATWTAIAAFYLGSASTLQTIFSTMSGGSGTGVVLHVTAGNKLQITVRNAGSVVLQQAMDAVTLSSGQWYVVGASVDAGGNSLKWRVAGTSESDSATYTSPASGAADGFKIATFTGVSSTLTNNSRMAALSIHSSALTDAQMGNVIAYLKKRLS